MGFAKNALPILRLYQYQKPHRCRRMGRGTKPIAPKPIASEGDNSFHRGLFDGFRKKRSTHPTFILYAMTSPTSIKSSPLPSHEFVNNPFFTSR